VLAQLKGGGSAECVIGLRSIPLLWVGGVAVLLIVLCLASAGCRSMCADNAGDESAESGGAIIGWVNRLVIETLQTVKEEAARSHVISHRGASGEEIEHTLAAYDLAVLYGSKNLEQDVVISKDGTLYVSHDLSANRLTGVNREYSEMSDKEIDSLSTEDGQRILKLADVLSRYKGAVTFVVELKSSGETAAFVGAVKAAHVEDSVIVQCFDLNTLEEVEAICPDMPKMYLISKQEAFDLAVNTPWIDIVAVDASLMDADNCSLAHQAGKLFNVWTLDTAEEIKHAIDLGVDSYFTNYTAKALALEKEYRKPGLVER